mgnify:CR=1 FL=1
MIAFSVSETDLILCPRCGRVSSNALLISSWTPYGSEIFVFRLFMSVGKCAVCIPVNVLSGISLRRKFLILRKKASTLMSVGYSFITGSKTSLSLSWSLPRSSPERTCIGIG